MNNNKYIISAILIYLLSICDILASQSVFWTKLLILGVLYSTVVDVELVTEPVILGILLSISLILAL